MESPSIKFWLWVAAFAATFFLFGAWSHDSQGLFGQTSAAWVQAIGSVGAILGLVMVSRAEQQRAVNAEKNRQLSMITAVGKIVHRAAMIVVIGSLACVKEGNVDRWPRAGHRSALAALNSIDLAGIPDPVLIDLILSVRWNTEQSLALVNQAREQNIVGSELVQVIERLKNLGEASEKTVDAVSKLFPFGVDASWRNT